MNLTKGGFSLFELTIAIVILAILSMMVIPFYHNTKAKQEAQLIPVKLRMHLQQAKQHAVLYHNNVVVCASEDFESCSQNAWTTGFISFLDLNQNRSRETHEKLLNTYPMQLRYGNLRWQGSLGSPSLVFQGDTGLPRGSIGSFLYCSQYNSPHSKVILSMTGIVRDETPLSC
ncbi:hypothetical protein F975_02269 [Acinetobacter sp. ANC 3789]|uniref:GspH/FimT family pseudopilin n=1 Tax=unclassified Acinetobacter TaxID=196816 RepID=UPI0002D054BC|nr:MULTISPECIES: GspH/FimT family pseudopilin [unclassified Acinetobacter]ENU79640.1 hypothetical protein F975_02269 [Acinetobacter sp. ANC 3789]TCB83828.1 prepilin-type N-terminal cleavage/methylation domain-containing protein [Acinetobacter sp. ANC 3791]